MVNKAKQIYSESVVADVVKLSRWKEYFYIVVLVSFLPVLLGSRVVDWRLTALFLANLGSFAFAFMINEVEDAEDDLKDKKRVITNPVALGKMGYGVGWWVSMMVASMSLVSFALLGVWPFVVGVGLVALALGYSWKKVRFKSWPVMDIVSHVLTLGGLQYVVGYLVYGGDWYSFWLVLTVVFLVSTGGQFANQLRDLEADKLAKLRNTTSLIPLRIAKLLSQITSIVAGVCVIGLVLIGVIPIMLVLVVLGLVGLFMLLRIGVTETSRELGHDREWTRQLLWVITPAVNLSVVMWLVVATNLLKTTMVWTRMGMTALMHPKMVSQTVVELVRWL